MPQSNLCIFNIMAAQTALLNSGPEYYYDVKVQCAPSGNIYTIEEGFISFLPAVTQAPLTMVLPSQTLPPLEPLLFSGPVNPNGQFAAPIGARFWIVPPVPGQIADFVNIDGGMTWAALSTVASSPVPPSNVPAVIIANIPVIYYGPSPPPNGLVVPVGTRYWVTPPIPGQPGEYVALDNIGTWAATNMVGG